MAETRLMQNVVMMGIPGSGKTKIRNRLTQKQISFGQPFLVYSTDDYIEKEAEKSNLSYSEIFSTLIKEAKVEQEDKICENHQLVDPDPIIWDQTNVTIKKRKSVLKDLLCFEDVDIKTHNTLIFVDTPYSTCVSRNNTREGKSIADNIISKMFSQMQRPTYDEGWDLILMVKNDKVFKMERLGVKS